MVEDFLPVVCVCVFMFVCVHVCECRCVCRDQAVTSDIVPYLLPYLELRVFLAGHLPD